MQTNVRQTSIDSFYALKDLGARQREVYNCVNEFGPLSNLDIASRLQKPINQITGRTFELVAGGLVEESHRGISLHTGRKVIFWRVT